MVKTICVFCKKEFYISPSRLKASERKKYGRGKFCSRKCKDESQKDKKPWNYGLSGEEYKIHYPAGFGGIFTPSRKKFDGTTKEYLLLHYWVRKNLGNDTQCSRCNKRFTGKNIHWANKSGKYLKNKHDWIRLCVKCHYEHDRVDKRKAGKLPTT